MPYPNQSGTPGPLRSSTFSAQPLQISLLSPDFQLHSLRTSFTLTFTARHPFTLDVARPNCLTPVALVNLPSPTTGSARQSYSGISYGRSLPWRSGLSCSQNFARAGLVIFVCRRTCPSEVIHVCGVFRVGSLAWYQGLLHVNNL